MPPRKGPERFSGEWWNTYTEVDTATGCINWTGTRCREGRGRTWYKGRGGVPVYRVVYEQCYGDVPANLKVCHACDNPSCVNPYHLVLGTQKDNLRDMFAKGRARPQGTVAQSNKARILALFYARPELTHADIAAELGITKARVDYVLRSVGVRAGGPRLAPVAAVLLALGELASENSNGGVATTDSLHLMRTGNTPKGEPQGWRQVLGVPPVQPTQAVQLWKRPREWTGNQQLNKGSAPWCADAASPVLPALRRSLRRA